MIRLIHWLAHWTGWNHGNVETWWEGETLMVGFRCTCGRLSGVHTRAKGNTHITPKGKGKRNGRG